MIRLSLYILVGCCCLATCCEGMRYNLVRPLDLSRRVIDANSNYVVELRTSVFRYQHCSQGRRVLVDLYSTTHVGDAEYYESLQEKLRRSDAVLFELITSRANLLAEPKDSSYKRRLQTDVYSAQAEALADQFGLQSQLDMDLRLPNWFVADLDAETVERLEERNRPKVALDYLRSVIGGRSVDEDLLKRFYISDRAFVFLLRCVSWLAPCPELSCLLIDWSRTQAGGVPFQSLLIPMLEHLLAGNPNAAKKLAFAQSLLSGVPDSGSWGGEARSDIAVRITARNEECCRILQKFIEDFSNSPMSHNGGEPRIAVLYGAYHVKDLAGRFESDLGLIPITDSDPETIQRSSGSSDKLVAWKMPGPRETERTLGSATPGAIGGAMFIASAYLFFGALDWWLAIDIFAHAIERYCGIAVSAEMPMRLMSSASRRLNEIVAHDPENALFLAATYLLLYFQRHKYLLNQISTVGIKWDRGLFADL